jgi:hypothetical protein
VVAPEQVQPEQRASVCAASDKGVEVKPLTSEPIKVSAEVESSDPATDFEQSQSELRVHIQELSHAISQKRSSLSSLSSPPSPRSKLLSQRSTKRRSELEVEQQFATLKEEFKRSNGDKENDTNGHTLTQDSLTDHLFYQFENRIASDPNMPFMFIGFLFCSGAVFVSCSTASIYLNIY